jgi:DNA polymerase I-like protein with 3'-5' exonuclease and polymerase domains
VPEETVGRVAEIVRECMEGAVELRVPLQVKIHVGPNWAELKPLV